MIFNINSTRGHTGSLLVTSDEYTVIYSGGHKHERGVGILLDEQISKCLIGYWTISDRIMLVKLKGKPFDISIKQVYAPTADKSEVRLPPIIWRQ